MIGVQANNSSRSNLDKVQQFYVFMTRLPKQDIATTISNERFFKVHYIIVFYHQKPGNFTPPRHYNTIGLYMSCVNFASHYLALKQICKKKKKQMPS